MQYSNLYYSFRKIDGYNKDINIVISCREAGKSTDFWLNKSYRPFRKTGQTTLYLVRNVVEITEAFLTSIQDNIINKFTDDNVELEYNKGAFKDGIVDIKIDGKLYCRILAMSIPLRRIKLSLLKDVAIVGMDEFIVNTRKGEKFLKGEAFIISEIYTTYKRERKDKTKPLKIYLMGNPYSLANPIFMWLKVDTNKLKLGKCYVGDNFVIDYYRLNDELRAKILKDNPLYEFDEEFKKYAFDGTAINDNNIKVGKLPSNYNLRFVFRHEGKYIGIYQNNYWEDHQDRYYCDFIDKEVLSNQRTAYCFDFAELVNGCALLSSDDKNRFNRFKIAMRKRQITFSSISIYYLIEEIYYNI